MSAPADPGPAPPRSWRRRVGRAVLLYAVVPYLAVTAGFALLQRRLLYCPTAAADLSVAAVGLDSDRVKDVELTTDDGITLRGWHLRAAGRETFGQAPLVVAFPGNSLNRAARTDDLREIAGFGFDVLLIDYRGFGDSGGSPSGAALMADARRIWEHARGELGYGEDRIALFGESLGGAVALSLWSRDGDPPVPAGVVLSSTFADMPGVVGWHYPAFPFRFLLLDRWPSADRIRRVDVPVVVFHGAEDAIVPLEQGRALAAANPAARFVELPGRGHNDLPPARLRAVLRGLFPGEWPAANSEPADAGGVGEQDPGRGGEGDADVVVQPAA